MLAERESLNFPVRIIEVRKEIEWVVNSYDLVVSAHCKQLFPTEVVRRVRCINIHPGLNPHNRGWYPQIFSILNGKPLGATIHVIDEHLDHGPIIAQEEISVRAWDTSLTAYDRVVAAELRLIRQHLPSIIADTAESQPPAEEGNLNLRRDFERLLELDLEAVGTWKAHLDHLRALTHGSYSNSFFIDPATGTKVFVRLILEPENKKSPPCATPHTP